MCLGMSKDCKAENKVSIVTLRALSLNSANQNHSLLWLMLQETFFQYGIICNLPPNVFLAASSLITVPLKRFPMSLPNWGSAPQKTFIYYHSPKSLIRNCTQLFKKRLSPAQMQQSRKPQFSHYKDSKSKWVSLTMSPWAPETPELGNLESHISTTQMGKSFHLSLKIPYPPLECSKRGNPCNYTILTFFTKLRLYYLVIPSFGIFLYCQKCQSNWPFFY